MLKLFRDGDVYILVMKPEEATPSVFLSTDGGFNFQALKSLSASQL